MRNTLIRLTAPLVLLIVACDGDPVTPGATLTISGVVHEQAAPSAVVPGAEVRFGIPVTPGAEPDWVEAATDAEGRYQLQLEAPVGCAANDSTDVRYEADATGYVPFTSMVLSLSQRVSCGSPTQTFDIPLQPEAS